jgi:hypothetical protein
MIILRIVFWRGTAFVLGKNTAMRMMLAKSEGIQ